MSMAMGAGEVQSESSNPMIDVLLVLSSSSCDHALTPKVWTRWFPAAKDPQKVLQQRLHRGAGDERRRR